MFNFDSESWYHLSPRRMLAEHFAQPPSLKLAALWAMVIAVSIVLPTGMALTIILAVVAHAFAAAVCTALVDDSDCLAQVADPQLWITTTLGTTLCMMLAVTLSASLALTVAVRYQYTSWDGSESRYNPVDYGVKLHVCIAGTVFGIINLMQLTPRLLVYLL